jgi:hypothetical protein
MQALTGYFDDVCALNALAHIAVNGADLSQKYVRRITTIEAGSIREQSVPVLSCKSMVLYLLSQVK